VPLSSDADIEAFKQLFSEAAIAGGFTHIYGGWFRESPECMVVLDLQRSAFGQYFDVNIKVFVRGLFGESHARTKEMAKTLTGDVFVRPPERFRLALDLDEPMPWNERVQRVGGMFSEFINPLTSDALTRSGLVSLAARGLVHLLPAVREQLHKD